MQILFSLPIPSDARARLEAKVAKGEVVAPQELERDYGAKAADVDKLVAWLKGQGFEITHITPNKTGVYARGTVGQISKSLEVQMARVTRDGITYNAARTAPSLPSDVGDGVHAIVGLQPFRHASKNSRMRTPSGGNRVSLGEENEEAPNQARRRSFATETAAAPTPNVANAPPYLVSEILRAYNGDTLGVTGAGQTIAILIDTFPADADLKKFWKVNGLPGSLNRIDKINVQGKTPPAMEGEETLDAQWTSGIAPDAKVRIYASGSLDFVDLDLALDQIIADMASEPGMRQLSISLGLGETYLGSADGEVATENQKFLTLSAGGVNVFVSTGDAGSNPDDTGHSPTGPLQAEFQSTSPYVVAVGGTTLTLTGAGAVAKEGGWTDGGGGKSIFFSRPSFQTGTGVPSGTERLVPDVSLVADPNTGALIIFQGRTQQIGGTSWSAPAWAGFCALMNEARTKAGKQALPFLNPLIYPIMSSGSFRDITTGSNGAYSAGTGYDLVTGIGVPDLKVLTDELKSK
jgi:kumamolisin